MPTASILPRETATASQIESRIVAVFAAIGTERMATLPICHPGLQVEAIGFRPYQGDWLGVLLTPWSLSLMTLPGSNGDFRALAKGTTQTWSFPSGRYDFIGNQEPTLGHYQLCSLMSPVLELTDQGVARLTARAVLEALFDDRIVDRSALFDRQTEGGVARVPAPPGPPDPLLAGKPAPVDRRRFFRAFMP